MSDWQPIETAPADTEVLVGGPGWVCTAMFSPADYWFATSGGEYVDYGGEYVELKEVRPTHWMPLPEPPQ